MSKTKLNSEYVVNNLLLIINNKLLGILDEIGTDYNIDSKDLIDKYCLTKDDLQDLTTSSNKRKKRKKRAILNDNDLCKAITAKNIRCSLRKSTGCELCLKHKNNIKFGRIDDNNFQDKEAFIKTKKEIIDGTEYLVDTDNIVYTFSTDLKNIKVLGKKVNNSVELHT